MKESELLKIEDVLKFFPDFVVIDEFKAEITASLDECSTRIADLKDEMKEYTESADRIRDDIKALRNRCVRARLCCVNAQPARGLPAPQQPQSERVSCHGVAATATCKQPRSASCVRRQC